ncbi:hypothetical protein Tco_0852779 [Tanacetum coccineum]
MRKMLDCKSLSSSSWFWFRIGSPPRNFNALKALKQGLNLYPHTLLFILVMESLHLSFKRVVVAGMFNVSEDRVEQAATQKEVLVSKALLLTYFDSGTGACLVLNSWKYIEHTTSNAARTFSKQGKTLYFEKHGHSLGFENDLVLYDFSSDTICNTPKNQDNAAEW